MLKIEAIKKQSSVVGAERVMLGVLQPGQQASVYKDALRRLADRLHYLNTGNNRFWFDVRP